MSTASVLFLLHAHLPYVRHPETEFSCEERWLFEAAVESYLPLLGVFDRLINDRVDFGLTVSLSPTLLEMLRDEHLRGRLERYIGGLIELAQKEVSRTRREPEIASLSRFYLKRTKALMRLYESLRGDIAGGFGAAAQGGHLELITTAATHAYLPNLSPCPEAVRAQVEIGIECFKGHFGRRPAGLWLPECGYYDGLERILREAGAKYFFLEGHGILGGSPEAKYGLFMPVRCPGGPAAFGRDAETSRLIWCAKTGYPADPLYRDFYRDIGYDLPLEYLRPHTHGLRIPTGLKYYRITGSEEKKPYMRGRAVAKARLHAADFIDRLRRRAEGLGGLGFKPLFTVPFDAELFGHWWFEGPEWLEFFMRGLGKGLRAVTAPEYLSGAPRLQSLRPAFSSWGYGGYSGTWINEKNDRFAAALHRACERMREVAKPILKRRNVPPLLRRALNQAMRELLLFESSDWPFLISSGTATGYAERRLKGHLEAFGRLCRMIEAKTFDEETIAAIEGKDRPFFGIDCASYAGPRRPATGGASGRGIRLGR